MMAIRLFLGHLHPLLVHLPIGILLLALLLEWRDRFGARDGRFQAASKLALGAGAVSALFSAGSGWLLAQQGEYDAAILDKHRWLGIATALCAVLLWRFYGKAYHFAALLLSTLLLAITGHLGGSLTHGENYLWANDAVLSPNASIQAAAIGPETPVYSGVIAPILSKKCVSCHNEHKKKGELELQSPEKILLGGKNGPVLVAGDPDKSELFKRVMLPLSDKGHMPPHGKIPLDNDEINLLKWWIAQGADFQKKTSELAITPDIQKILTPENHNSPVFQLPIAAADPALLSALKSDGIAVSPLGKGSNLLSVSLAGTKKWRLDQLKKLAGIAQQITILDAAYSNIDDPMLNAIGALPQLTRLNLSYSAVTGKGLKNLPQSSWLESLNLTGAAVGDEAIPMLQSLEHLQNFYCWQSKMTPEALNQWQQSRPKLQIQRGPSPEQEKDTLQLRPPKMLFSRTIFDDTVQVLLDFPHKGIELYYTLDEASPTTQSMRYTGEPIVLKNSTEVRAIAAKAGWKNSDPISGTFARRQYKPEKASLDHPPSPRYPGSGAASLIDGIMGEVYSDKSYIAYEGEHMGFDIDFGKMVDLHRINIHCIENNNAWIFLPKSIQLFTSADGKKFQPGPRKTYPVNSSMGVEKTHLLSIPFPTLTPARYIRVKVESLLKNPAWHPGAGQKCWIFLDEVLAE